MKKTLLITTAMVATASLSSYAYTSFNKPKTQRIQHTFVHPQVQTFNNQTKEVTGKVWGWENEFNVTPGNLIKPLKEQNKYFPNAPQVKQNKEAILTLLKWYQGIKYNPQQFALVKKHFDDTQIFCNYAVSIFRTLLQEQGIYSRPVILEYNDNYGGKSHTTMEAWDKESKSWIFVDPHFFIVNKNKNFTEASQTSEDLTYLPMTESDPVSKSRKKEVQKLFQEGTAFFYMKNIGTNTVYEYRNPKAYAMPPATRETFRKDGKHHFFYLPIPDND